MLQPNVPFVTPAMARSARAHFQVLYSVPQTDDDGFESATNVIGAFTVLGEWRERRDAARAAAAQTAAPEPTPAARATRPWRRRSPTSNKE